MTGEVWEKFRWVSAAFLRWRNPAWTAGRSSGCAVYGRMGYIIALVVLFIVVPLIFLMLSRRTPAGGGGMRHRDRGVTVEEPSSDQPTPGAEDATNQPRAGAERRIPPG